MYVLFFPDGLIITEYGDTEDVWFIINPVNEDRITCHLLEPLLIGRGKLWTGVLIQLSKHNCHTQTVLVPNKMLQLQNTIPIYIEASDLKVGSKR